MLDKILVHYLEFVYLMSDKILPYYILQDISCILHTNARSCIAYLMSSDMVNTVSWSLQVAIKCVFVPYMCLFAYTE